MYSTFPRPIVVLFLCVALTLVGCGSAGAPHATPGSTTRAEAAPATASAAGGAAQSADTEAALAADAPADSDGGKGSPPPAKVDAQKLKRSGWMTLEVGDEDDFEPIIERARQMVEAADGYVASESTSSITMMVPTGETEDFFDELASLGRVTARNVRVDDVTSQYVDLQIRIDNLEKTRKRLQKLLDQTVDVSEVLEVEKELSRVTTQLEQLEGQMRTMKRDTTYARLTLNVEESVSPGPVGWIFYGGYRAVKWLFVWD